MREEKAEGIREEKGASQSQKIKKGRKNKLRKTMVFWFNSVHHLRSPNGINQKALSMIFFIPAFFRSPNFFWCSTLAHKYLLDIDSKRRDLSRIEKRRPARGGSTLNELYPENAQSQNLEQEKYCPGSSPDYLTRPEESIVHDICVSDFARALEPPSFLAAFVDLAPPPESNQQSSSDILDNPKVQGAAENHQDEGDDGRIDNGPDNQVEEEGQAFEGKGRDTGNWMGCLLEIILAITCRLLLLFVSTSRFHIFDRLWGIVISSNLKRRVYHIDSKVQIVREISH